MNNDYDVYEVNCDDTGMRHRCEASRFEPPSNRVGPLSGVENQSHPRVQTQSTDQIRRLFFVILPT